MSQFCKPRRRVSNTSMLTYVVTMKRDLLKLTFNSKAAVVHGYLFGFCTFLLIRHGGFLKVQIEPNMKFEYNYIWYLLQL